MLQKHSTPLLVLTNLLIPLAILVFATGFFPYKPCVPGRANYEDDGDGDTNAFPPFDKVIFMVVDALRRLVPWMPHYYNHNDRRSDFVYSNASGFGFTQR